MKVALVHDWLTGMRGGEKCLEVFLSLYPEADVYTLIHTPKSVSLGIEKRIKKTSFLSKLPWVEHYYRYLLPLYPLAIKEFKLKGYDLVISVSHAAAKNVNIEDGAFHVCYCLTPMRYIWDQIEGYFGKWAVFVRPFLLPLRAWDKRGEPNIIVAISKFVAARVRCFYNKNALVIYPPVDTSWVKPVQVDKVGRIPKGEAFLYAGALVPYKRVDVLIRAFNKLNLPLWIVGTGPEEKNLKRLAGEKISFLGKVSSAELAGRYRRARALVFPVKEDFGMVPVECMAAGRPVIGLYGGALKETVVGLRPWDHYYNSTLDRSRVTGVFIQDETGKEVENLIESVRFFLDREGEFAPQACITQSQKYSLKAFFERWNIVPLSFAKITTGQSYIDVKRETPAF